MSCFTRHGHYTGRSGPKRKGGGGKKNTHDVTLKQLPPQSRELQNKQSDLEMRGGMWRHMRQGQPVPRKMHGGIWRHMRQRQPVPQKTRRRTGGGEEDDSEEDGSPGGRENEPGTQWPWGPAGRPSDQDEGQQRPNELTGEPPHKRPCLPTDKPNQPSGEPPRRPLSLTSTSKGRPVAAEGRVTLVPNLRWQVQRVQEYMARRRESATWPSSETE